MDAHHFNYLSSYSFFAVYVHIMWKGGPRNKLTLTAKIHLQFKKKKTCFIGIFTSPVHQREWSLSLGPHDNFMGCHPETEPKYQDFCVSQSHYTDTDPASRIKPWTAPCGPPDLTVRKADMLSIGSTRLTKNVAHRKRTILINMIWLFSLVNGIKNKLAVSGQ